MHVTVQSRCGYLTLPNGTEIYNCPTSFPCPNALGAAWNMSIVNDLGRVIATEARSLWLQGVGEDHSNGLPHIGLDCWSPVRGYCFHWLFPPIVR